ncbi:MAG: hypothetical protein JSW11_10590 [Candidatus Heimdallarchaeota archaeon]|nr:MAG: hypothetical protein JSW11_10590 [Candidatus Heimdallarchaeota archaeon]
MADENIIAQVKKILTQKYCISADETVETVGLCDNLGEALVATDFPEKDFYLRLLQHLRLFYNSEFMLFSDRIKKALSSYQKLQTGILETQTQYPDLYSQLQYDIDRLVLRVDARIQETRARIAEAENDIVQADVLYVETINRYNNELVVEQNKNDYDHYFNSLGIIFHITGHLYRLRGKSSKNIDDLYLALRNLKKAHFLGYSNIETLLDQTQREIMLFTLEKLEHQAELIFTQGLAKSEVDQFDGAKANYQKSAQLYHSLNKIQKKVEYELQEQIQYSSYYEATAKAFMIQDNNEQAALQFSYANQTLQKVLEKLPSDALKQTFEPQIKYFQAMQLFCRAVTEYDNMSPEAIDHFAEARDKLLEAKKMADENQNIPLSKGCTNALNKLDSYQEIAGLMFQETDDTES